MARPTKLDDVRAKRLLNAIAEGASLAGAARAAGIAESTLHDWLARGRDGEAPFAEFSERLTKAEGETEVRVTSALMRAIDNGHVGAMSFWLERRLALQWGKRDSAAGDHQSGAAGEMNELDVATLESVLAAAKSRKAG